jgi:hypothetical protein
MLARKGNADDGDKKNQTEYDMRDGDPDTGENEPEYVKDQVEATGASLCAYRHPAKRPKHKSREFKALQTERDADDYRSCS